MAGQVKHAKIFSGIIPDLTLLSVLTKLRARNTDALISAVAEVLRGRGDRAAQLHGVSRAAAGAGAARSAARAADRRRAGRPRVRLPHGRRRSPALDIGQTIVVKDKAVVAVEAMEGTDVVIRRAGEIAGPGTRIVKVAKPKQDMRFDVPVVGVATIEAMKAAGATAISIDAGKTLVVDGDAILRRGRRRGHRGRGPGSAGGAAWLTRRVRCAWRSSASATWASITRGSWPRSPARDLVAVVDHGSPSGPRPRPPRAARARWRTIASCSTRSMPSPSRCRPSCITTIALPFLAARHRRCWSRSRWRGRSPKPTR